MATKQSKAFHVAQIQGERSRQEDAYEVLEDKEGVWGIVVADGMGGHAGGDIASRTAVKTFAEALRESDGGSVPERLRDAAEEANAAILAAIRARPELTEMGSTLVAAVVAGNKLYHVSIGDSPLWLWRAQARELTRINEDHSMLPVLEKVARQKGKDPALARRDPRRNQLRSALGGDEIEEIDCPAEPRTIRPGDLVVLASDGVETLSPEAIGEILAGEKDTETAVERILAAVELRQAPRQDNATLCIWSPVTTAAAAAAAAAKGGKGTSRLPPRPAMAGAAVLLLVAGFAGGQFSQLWSGHQQDTVDKVADAKGEASAGVSADAGAGKVVKGEPGTGAGEVPKVDEKLGTATPAPAAAGRRHDEAAAQAKLAYATAVQAATSARAAAEAKAQAVTAAKATSVQADKAAADAKEVFADARKKADEEKTDQAKEAVATAEGKYNDAVKAAETAKEALGAATQAATDARRRADQANTRLATAKRAANALGARIP